MIQREPVVDNCNHAGIASLIRLVISQKNWSVAGPKLLGTICLLLLGGILVAGLWPFHAPKNQVTWLPAENGLRFGSHATILSAGSFKADAQDDAPCSFEIWLEPKVTAASGTLFAFYAPGSPRQLSAYQSITDLALRIDVQDASHQARINRLYIDDIFRKGKRLFITVTSNGVQTSVYVDGVLKRTGHRFPLSVHDFDGDLIIANSPRVDNSWSGVLRGLAFYPQNLTAEQIRQHFVTWTTRGRPEVSGNERMLALYLFNERSGQIVHNQVSTGTSLQIPERYTVLDQVFLSPFWKVFEPSWAYWEDVLVNIAGFIPFGFLFCAYFSLAGNCKRPVWVTILVGFIVSLTIESLQVYLPTRDSDMTDVITNVVGTCLGVWLYRSKFWRNPVGKLWASLGENSSQGKVGK